MAAPMDLYYYRYYIKQQPDHENNNSREVEVQVLLKAGGVTHRLVPFKQEVGGGQELGHVSHPDCRPLGPRLSVHNRNGLEPHLRVALRALEVIDYARSDRRQPEQH